MLNNRRTAELTSSIVREFIGGSHANVMSSCWPCSFSVITSINSTLASGVRFGFRLAKYLRFLRGVILIANMFDVDSGLGIRHMEFRKVFNNNPSQSEIPKPLVLSRDNEPRCMLGAAARQCVLVSRYIVVPEFS